jgi:hypothetical protein
MPRSGRPSRNESATIGWTRWFFVVWWCRRPTIPDRRNLATDAAHSGDGSNHGVIEVNTFSKRVLPLSALALAVLAQGIDAQRRYPQEKMQANYAAMLKHDWYTGGGWTTDFAAAKAEAKKTGKPIFAYFTRTYAA